MDYRKINEDIKSGVLNVAAPILLCSKEQLLLDFYETRLLESFGADPLDVVVYYGNNSDDDLNDDIISDLDTYPMFSAVRVAIVKNHPKITGKIIKDDGSVSSSVAKDDKADKRLTDYFTRIPDTARLVFTSNEVKKNLTLYKAIQKTGTVYEIARLDESDLRQFVLKRFKKAGTVIQPDILDEFIYTTGYLAKDSDVDLLMVENDTYKLAYYVMADRRSDISRSDIAETTPGILRTDDFAMLDAISTGKKSEAINLLENTLAGDENITFRLLALLIGHFEIMIGYKELSASGMNSSQITKALGQHSEWRVKKLGGFAQRFDIEKLTWILGRLYETDSAIKSGDIRVRDALTVLLAEI